MLLTQTFTFDAIHAGAGEIFMPAVELSVLASYEGVQIHGEPDLIVELIDLYHEDAGRRLAVMRESLAKRNWQSLTREAHGLRGSSSNLGAHQLALICSEIERIGSDDLSSNSEALLDRLELELELALDILFAERQRRSQ